MKKMMTNKAIVVGGGLAGVEAASQLAKRGYRVDLYEMKPHRFSPAHKSPNLAELVCSNSLKAERLGSAAGLLKAEMQKFGSLCLEAAEKTRVPAGGALAVDRDAFSQYITDAIRAEKNINLILEEVEEIPQGDLVILATGPLVSDALAKKIADLCGGLLSFYDAAAPIITADSIDMNYAFSQSRYDRGQASDYINCPLNKEEYESFYKALLEAESAETHAFDKRRGVYEACIPIEVLASRGLDTMRYGPMKPVGLTDPRTGKRPWAVLQLRKENKEASLYNLVGFQTNLKFGEQARVFSMIPALKNAEFVRYGVMHRNTFINSPKLLLPSFAMKARPNLFFAGQITGVEGYMESAASGILAGINGARYLASKPPLILPHKTMLGGITHYISSDDKKNFQPMGAAFGLLPPLDEKIRDKQERYALLANRSLKVLDSFLEENKL